jgi:aminopeptidase N
MRTEQPVPVRLADYAPFPFRVDTVHLHFALEPSATRVRARLQLQRQTPGPLVLDAVRLKLISVAIDGRPLAPATTPSPTTS